MSSHSPDILIFVDNKGSMHLYESFLSLGNCFLHFAEKNESGFLKLDNQSYDLIIVEISQPLLSEVQFIDQLKNLNSYVPIVIVSEFFNETRNTVFGNKISEFISKPLTLNKLYDTVKVVLDPKLQTKASTGEFASGDDCKRLSILYEISKSLNSITNFDVLLNTLVMHATDAMNAERATLFVLDKDRDELWSRVGIGIERQEIRFSKDKGIAGNVVNTGNSIISDDPYANPLFNKDFDMKSGFTTRNLICVPMRNIKGDVVGAFQVLNKKDGRFDSQDELFLSAMAASTAIALENTLLYEERKMKYLEMQKLYDELYIAQNMIVWESKHSTISEIRGFLHEIRQYDGVSKIAGDLIDNNETPEFVKEKVSKIKDSYDKTFIRMGKYLNHLINSLDEEKIEEVGSTK